MNFKNILLLLGLLIPIFGNAQEADNNWENENKAEINTWDLGLFLGISQHGGDIQSWGMDGESLLNQSNFGYGAKYGYYGAPQKKSFFKRKA